MEKNRNELSKYRAMWTFALFDLPVTTPEHKKAYMRFRKALQAMGFTMLQFSVYARYTPSHEGMKSLRSKIRRILPEEGEVRLVSVTDTQFAKMEVFTGNKKVKPERKDDQFMLF